MMVKEFRSKEMTSVGPIGEKTNIDRKECKRVVPMKVLCAGLGRTGTSSMRAALIELGFVDCYHMFSIVEENTKDADMWVEAFAAKFEGKGKQWGREEFDQIFGHCMAATDWPCATFVDDLVAAYPDAKVILTVRDNVEVWHRSVTETLWTGNFVFGPPKTNFQALFQKMIPKPAGYLMFRMLYRHTLLKDHPEAGKDGYLAHNEHVRAIAPKGQFLEYNVKEGWEPLCRFLEVDVPESRFPRVNDADSTKEYMETAKKAALLELLGPISVLLWCVGALGAAYWWAWG